MAEQRTDNAKVMGSITVEARYLLRLTLQLLHKCEDHTLHSIIIMIMMMDDDDNDNGNGNGNDNDNDNDNDNGNGNDNDNDNDNG